MSPAQIIAHFGGSIRDDGRTVTFSWHEGRKKTELNREDERQLIDALCKIDDLSAFSLWHRAFSDEGFEELSRFLPDTRSVYLINVDVSSRAGAALANWKGLERLHVRGCSLAPRALEGLSRLKKLLDLEIDESGTNVTDEDLQFLPDCVALEKLWLIKTGAKGRCLARRSGLSHLQILNLKDSPIDDAACQDIAHLPALETLILSSQAVGDRGVESLRSAPRLQTLSLQGTRCSDAAIPSLLAMRSLKSVAFGRSQVTGIGILQMLGAKWPGTIYAGPSNLSRNDFLPAGKTEATRIEWSDDVRLESR